MKIALFVPGGVDPERGHAIPVLLELIRSLAASHQLLVIAIGQDSGPSTYPLLGARVVNLPGSKGRPVFRFRRALHDVLALLREQGPFDVLHAIWILGPGTLAAAAARLLRVPLVLSLGGGELARLPEIAYGGALRVAGRVKSAAALRSAAAITAGSRYALAALNGHQARATWLPLGVNKNFFSGVVERGGGPPWRLVNVGGLNLVKDHATLLSAVRRLRDGGIDVSLDCFGVDTLAGRMQSLAKKLDLEAAVTFHGHVAAEVLLSNYRRAHVLVQSSLHESMGAAVLEAAACGLPVVGTAVGLLPEMASVATCAARDPEKLAGVIRSVLDDRERRFSLALAQQRFARTYDAGWTARRFEELYARVSAAAKRGAAPR